MAEPSFTQEEFDRFLPPQKNRPFWVHRNFAPVDVCYPHRSEISSGAKVPKLHINPPANAKFWRVFLCGGVYLDEPILPQRFRLLKDCVRHYGELRARHGEHTPFKLTRRLDSVQIELMSEAEYDRLITSMRVELANPSTKRKRVEDLARLVGV